MRHFPTVWALVTLCLLLPAVRLAGQELPADGHSAADVGVFLRALSDPDRGVRFAAAQALGKCADPDTLPALVRAMSDPEWCVRAQAARSIRGFGPVAIPLLSEALGAPDPATRLVAVNALARMGEAGRAVLPLALDDVNERVRYIAARTLADASTVPALRGLLSAANPVIGIEAAAILIDLGEGRITVPTLLAGLREYRGVSRTRVAELLRRTGACGSEEAEAIVEILLATKQDDYRLRTALADLLVAIGGPAVGPVRTGAAKTDGGPWRSRLDRILENIEHPRPHAPEPQPEPAVEPDTAETLLAELADPGEDPDERRFAAELLSLDPEAREGLLRLLGNPVAAEDALGAILAMEGGLPETEEEAMALAASPAPAARRLGIRGLRALGRTDALGSLVDDGDEAVRATARWALSPIRPEPRPKVAPLPPVSLLVERLADPDLAVSLAAADALPLHGGAAALPLAKKMASGHYGVLHYAEWIYMQLGSQAAPATPALVSLLGHEDVNVREVAARSLGEIGPDARAAVPALLQAFRDIRISVRGRAAVALGRIGEAAGPALVEAAGDPDARVRAGAVFALGWIRGEEGGLRQVATDIRLPVAEPGPAEATGLVPTPEQVERARAFARARGREEAAGVLADLPEQDAVAVLRAGLRLSDVRVAVACAAGLAMEDLDAWEAERCVELLLPEVFRPDPPVGFGQVYEYLGSSEVPATLGYLALSDASETDRTFVTGNCQRIVRWDLLPELYRIEATGDAWVVEGSIDAWMPRWWSDRYRDLDALSIPGSGEPGMEEGEGLPETLRRVLGRGLPLDHYVRAWLNDSVPGERDAPLLLDLARRVRDEDGAWEDLTTLLRALGHLRDRESERFLLESFMESDPEGHFARAALARRGDPDALRRLAEDAGREWLPLSLLMEVSPEAGAAAFGKQVVEGDGRAPCWDLADSFQNVRWYGVRWPDGLFDGVEPAALGAKLQPGRLARIALMTPGCRTAAMAEAILAGLEKSPTGLFKARDDDGEEAMPEPSWPDRYELFAFLHSAAPVPTIDLLRTWLRGSDPEPRRFALSALLVIGDPESAPLLVEALADWDPEIDGEESEVWHLSRSASPVVEEFLRRTVEDPDAEAGRRMACLRELAILYGLPGDTAWPSRLTLVEPAELDPATLGRVTALVLDRRPTEAVLESFRGEDPDRLADLSALGSMTGSVAARNFLRGLARRRGERSYPEVVGQLARLGDVAARRELWSAFRAGRYRWICYENDYDALTLGRDPATYPALLAELESNCCRGGHVARMFEERMGDDALDYRPHGQDATPARNAREWLRLYGGRWVWSPIAGDPYGFGGWIPAPR